MVGQSVQAWAQTYCKEVSKLERVELITGVQRRRRYFAHEEACMVAGC